MSIATATAPTTTPEPFKVVNATVVLPATASADEWLAERRNGLGGSDIAAAVGIDRYNSPYSLWLLKTGRRIDNPSPEQQERMYTGQLLEPVLRDEFARRHPEYVITRGEGTYAIPGQEWRRCNVDGLVWTPEGELAGVLECKTGNHRQLDAWAGDEIPLSYTVQGQWSAAVVGAPRIFYIALIDTNTWIEKAIDRDDELVADLVELGAEFWRHVETDTEPPIDGHTATADALMTRPAEPGKTVELDPEFEKDFRRRAEIQDQINALNEEKREIDNRIRAALGDAELGKLNGRKVATFKAPSAPTRKVADWKAFKKQHPRIYKRWVTEIPAARRLAISYKTEQNTKESDK